MKTPVHQYASWIESATADNATATATRAAPTTGLSHYITSVSGSYDKTNADGQLVLKDGDTEIARWTVPDQRAFTLAFPSPIKLSPATAANLALDASGTASTSGTAVLSGYTL